MRKRLLIALMTGSLALGAVSTYAVNGMIGTKEGEIVKENNRGFDSAEEKEAQKKASQEWFNESASGDIRID